MLTGDEIRQARERAGLTQGDLAALVGVSLRTVGNWERGAAVPRNRAAKIEDALGVHTNRPGGNPLEHASDAQLLAEIARRFERGRTSGTATTRAGESPAARPTLQVAAFDSEDLEGETPET